MQHKKNNTTSKNVKIFKINSLSPPHNLLEDNINEWLKQMDYSFKILCLVGIYFLGHFMVTFPMPSWFGIINICIGIGAMVAAWKCFFEHKNAIHPEVKAFLEKYSSTSRK